MAKYTYLCPSCELTCTVEVRKEFNCDMCGSEMKRQFLAPHVVLKGAAAANGYYIPPSNAELGLPSEYELTKEMTKNGDHFIDPLERDLKKDYDDEKRLKVKNISEKAEKVKDTNPELYKKFREAQDKLKRK